MIRLTFPAILLATAAIPVLAQDAVAPVAPPFDAAAFVTPKDNPWFPLAPGQVNRYRGTNLDGEVEDGTVTVLGAGPTLMGVATIEVLDEVRVDTVLVERTHDFYANDADGNTWYFGEDVTNYTFDEAGTSTGTDTHGSWRAGLNGAMPGISVPGDPAVGDPPTFQEIAPNDEAMDWAQTTATGLTLEGPAGSYADVVQVFESSIVEPTSRGYKYYAPGIGLVREEELAETGDVVEMTVDLQP